MTTLQREALEAARHDLVTFDGLVVADGAAPQETFILDTKQTIAKLDAALSEASETDMAPS